MKILVAVKRVVDYHVKVRVKSDGSGVETNNVKMSINPFDEIAVEQAVQLKEQGIASEVVVVTVGADAAQETLRHALAMGADRAIHVKDETDFESINIAKVLKAVVEKENPQLVILGKQAIDDDCNQTGQMLAALLAWGQGTFASKLEFQGEQVQVTREVDGGLNVINLQLPAVITTDLRLNEPRFIKLPNIMQAKKKPLDELSLAELGVELTTHTKVLKVETPPQREAGIKVSDINELLDKLKNQHKVIA